MQSCHYANILYCKSAKWAGLDGSEGFCDIGHKYGSVGMKYDQKAQIILHVKRVDLEALEHRPEIEYSL